MRREANRWTLVGSICSTVLFAYFSRSRAALVPGSSIAERLYRSAHTVHTHVKALFKRFAVHTRAELVSRLLAADIELQHNAVAMVTGYHYDT